MCDEYEIQRILRSGFEEIEGYPNQFVNQNGDVVRVVYGEARQIKVYVDKCGNHIVTLIDENGFCDNFEIAVLVASKYISNPDDLPFVRHMDFDRSNNTASNLMWDSVSDDQYILEAAMSCPNYMHCSHGGVRQKHGIYCLDTDELYPSIGIAARELMVDPSNLSRALKRKNGICKFGGYKVCYAELKDEASWSPCYYILVVNTHTMETYSFDSIRKASDELGVNRSTIQYHIKTGKALNGLVFTVEKDE